MDIFDKKQIEPMLIAEHVEPYNDTNSIFELKLDGIRCIAYCDTNSVDLRNKRNIKLLPRFPELQNIYKQCNQKCILDGELIVMVNGKPDFYEVQKRTLLTDPFKIQLSYTKYPASFVAYDILYINNALITETPLIQRKNFLTNTIVENDKISVSRFIENNGIELFNLAKKNKLEGVVGKGRNSLYWFGKRSHDWKKIKVMEDYEAIAIGYIHKPNNMTSLILAQYDDEQNLKVTNHVTLGVSLSKLKQQGLKEASCPLRIIPKGHDNTIWIKPFVCTVEYMPSEKEGLRQAVFKGIRTDKSPEECVT